MKVPSAERQVSKNVGNIPQLPSLNLNNPTAFGVGVGQAGVQLGQTVSGIATKLKEQQEANKKRDDAALNARLLNDFKNSANDILYSEEQITKNINGKDFVHPKGLMLREEWQAKGSTKEWQDFYIEQQSKLLKNSNDPESLFYELEALNQSNLPKIGIHEAKQKKSDQDNSYKTIVGRAIVDASKTETPKELNVLFDEAEKYQKQLDPDGVEDVFDSIADKSIGGALLRDGSGVSSKFLLSSIESRLSPKKYTSLEESIDKRVKAIEQKTQMKKLTGQYYAGADLILNISSGKIDPLAKEDYIKDLAVKEVIGLELGKAIDKSIYATITDYDDAGEDSAFSDIAKRILTETDIDLRNKTLVEIVEKYSGDSSENKQKMQLLVQSAMEISTDDKTKQKFNKVLTPVLKWAQEAGITDDYQITSESFDSILRGTDPDETIQSVIHNETLRQKSSDEHYKIVDDTLSKDVVDGLLNEDFDSSLSEKNIYQFLLKEGIPADEAAATTNEIFSNNDATSIGEKIIKAIPSLKYKLPQTKTIMKKVDEFSKIMEKLNPLSATDANAAEIKDKSNRVVDILKRKFDSPNVVAGILGNVDHETGGTFDFQQEQIGGGGGYGLIQMTYPPMKKAYDNFLEKNNIEDGAESQIDFVSSIMENDEYYDIGAGNRNKLKKAIATDDPEIIAEAFSIYVERPGKPQNDKRKAAAKKWSNILGTKEAEGSELGNDSTVLSQQEEEQFRKDYAAYSKTTGMHPNPDNPKHFYDYRGQWKKSGLNVDNQGHLSSEFKLDGHPRMTIDGVNTKTGKKLEQPTKISEVMFNGLQDYSKLVEQAVVKSIIFGGDTANDIIDVLSGGMSYEEAEKHADDVIKRVQEFGPNVVDAAQWILGVQDYKENFMKLFEASSTMVTNPVAGLGKFIEYASGRITENKQGFFKALKVVDDISEVAFGPTFKALRGTGGLIFPDADKQGTIKDRLTQSMKDMVKDPGFGIYAERIAEELFETDLGKNNSKKVVALATVAGTLFEAGFLLKGTIKQAILKQKHTKDLLKVYDEIAKDINPIKEMIKKTRSVNGLETTDAWLNKVITPENIVNRLAPNNTYFGNYLKGVIKKTIPEFNIPVGMSIQDISKTKWGTSYASQPLKSNLFIQAWDKLPNKSTGSQMLKTLVKGLSPEEIEFSGVDMFLNGKKEVTKTEVMDYITDNQVVIEPIIKSNQETKNVIELLSQKEQARYNELRSIIDSNDWSALGREESLEYQDLKAKAEALSDDEVLNTTKYDQYTLPGGTNYKETLLTLHSGDRQGINYESSHFDEKNIIVHNRTNDRVAADGSKIRFVEEIQSDWHQEGKKKGYIGKNETRKQYGISFGDSEPNLFFDTKQLAEERIAKIKSDYAENFLSIQEVERNVVTDYERSRKITNAPFKTTWHELALKDIIRQAVEDGVDHVAFISGQQTADRYDLSKHVDHVNYVKLKEGKYNVTVFGKQSEIVWAGNLVDSREIEKYLGKEITLKIQNGEGKSDGKSVKKLENVDLKVGGEWAKKFYDEILPKSVDKYIKKWGGKVEDIEIQGTNLPSTTEGMTAGRAQEWLEKSRGEVLVQKGFTITPAMRKEVADEGQPLFGNSLIRGMLKSISGKKGQAGIESAGDTPEEIEGKPEIFNELEKTNIKQVDDLPDDIRPEEIDIKASQKRGNPKTKRNLKQETEDLIKSQGKKITDEEIRKTREQQLLGPETIDEIILRKRGIITDKEAVERASKMKGTIDDVLNIPKGTVPNKEQLTAIAQIVQQEREINKKLVNLINNGGASSTPSERKLIQSLQDGTDITEAEALQQALEQNTIKLRKAEIVLMAAKSEAGRALQGAKQVIDSVDSRLRIALNKLKKLPLIDRQAMTEQLATVSLDDNDEFLNFLDKITTSDFFDKFGEWATAIKLYNPTTHIVNFGSNTVRQLSDMMITGGLSPQFTKADAQGALVGLKQGIKNSLRAMTDEGYASQLSKYIEEGGIAPAIGGNLGKTIRTSFRMLGASDEVFKAIAYQRSLYRQAARITNNDPDKMKEILERPTFEMMDKAYEIAKRMTFQENMGEITKSFNKFRTPSNFKNPVAKSISLITRIFVPFLKTPTNLAKQAVDFSPLGLVKNQKLLIDSVKSGDDETAKRIIGEAVFGSMIMAGVAALVLDNRITGGAPRNKSDRDQFFREKKLPYAIKIGNTWYQYKRIDPFSTVIGITADAITLAGDGNFNFGSIVDLVSKNLEDKTFLRGVDDLMKLATGEPYERESALRNSIIGSAIPSFIGHIARTIDPTIRMTDNIVESAMSQIPFASKRLPARVNALGAEIERANKGLMYFFSPIQSMDAEIDPVTKHLADIEYNISLPSSYFTRDKVKYELTPKEYEDFSKFVGERLAERISYNIDSPRYYKKSNDEKIKTIEKDRKEIMDEWKDMYLEDKGSAAGNKRRRSPTLKVKERK